MSGYKTVKTTMGHKLRVKMSQREMEERQTFALLVTLTPFVLCWLFAIVAGMV